MYNDYNSTSGNENNNKSSSLITAVVLTALIAVLSAISAGTSLRFTVIIAAAAFAYMIELLRYPVLSLISIVLSFGITYLIAGNLMLSIQNAATILIIGALSVFCRKKSLGFFKSSLILGGAIAIISLSVTALSLQLEYGNIIEGAKKISGEMYNAVLAYFKTAAGLNEGTMLISENEIEMILSALVTMLPGIAAAAVQIIGAAIYFLIKLFIKLFGKSEPKKEEKENGKVPTGAVIFFVFSCILALIFSLFESLEVPYLASLNMCIALCVPTFFDGVSRITKRTKKPPVTIESADGTIVKRRPNYLLIVIVVSAFFSILFPIMIVLSYSVTGTIKDIISNSKKN